MLGQTRDGTTFHLRIPAAGLSKSVVWGDLKAFHLCRSWFQPGTAVKAQVMGSGFIVIGHDRNLPDTSTLRQPHFTPASKIPPRHP